MTNDFEGIDFRMLFWDRQLLPAKSMLASFTQQQRLKLILDCIEDVRSTFESDVLATASAQARDFFASAFDLLDSAHDVSQVSRAQSQEVLQEMSWIAEAPPGVWDLAMSLTTILQRCGESLSVDDTLNAMGCAYQVVLHVEIMRGLDRDVFESEIEQMEKANTTCVDTIERQLRRIDQISSSNPDNPTTS